MSFLIYSAGFAVGALIAVAFTLYFTSYQESNSLTLVGQYTVYNYTTDDGVFKLFLLSKEKLNQSIVLTNENDITEKILLVRLPY